MAVRASEYAPGHIVKCRKDSTDSQLAFLDSNYSEVFFLLFRSNFFTGLDQNKDS